MKCLHWPNLKRNVDPLSLLDSRDAPFSTCPLKWTERLKQKGCVRIHRDMWKSWRVLICFLTFNFITREWSLPSDSFSENLLCETFISNFLEREFRVFSFQFILMRNCHWNHRNRKSEELQVPKQDKPLLVSLLWSFQLSGLSLSSP